MLIIVHSYVQDIPPGTVNTYMLCGDLIYAATLSLWNIISIFTVDSIIYSLKVHLSELDHCYAQEDTLRFGYVYSLLFWKAHKVLQV